MSVGFSFLVKDPELSRLRVLIEYLREISDEFVFTIDSRTQHRTLTELSTWPGSTVLAFDWNDNFSDARNYGLPWIKSEWTAYFDPDEMPNHRLLEFMRTISSMDLKTESAPLGYLFDTHNFWGGQNMNSHLESDWHCRMWQTGHGKFYKPVHEQVELDGKKEDRTRGTDILKKAPEDSFIIHSKPQELIATSLADYVRIESR